MEIHIPSGAAGKILLDRLVDEKHLIPADCGGKGTCGKCKVTVISGEFYMTASKNGERKPYPPDENGQILACRAICPESGAKIRINVQSGEGIIFPVISGKTADILFPDASGKRDNITFSATSDRTSSGGVSQIAFALDIGTTTLAGALVDTQSGEILKTFSELNPQKSRGADVISRIKACGEGHLSSLTELIQSSVQKMLDECIRLFPDKKPDTLAVAGNPTMLHIFCGISPQGMGAYPFTPVFLDTKHIGENELSLTVRKIIILPSISAFLGSDITGGVFVAKMKDYDAPSLLIDIGTNGEIVFCSGKQSGSKLIAVSTAAGPALEGANISCGTGGVPGAISGMEIEDNKTSGKVVTVRYTTVCDKPPVGICGSGLIDLVAILLKTGIIDETGYISREPFYLADSEKICFRHVAVNGSPIPESAASSIYITQKDIREFQLAKSAIRAGTETLLMHAKCEIEQIGRVFLAGGLGYYMSPRSAAEVGLLSPEAMSRAEAVGNTSLAGVRAALCLEGALREMELIAGDCKTHELNRDPVFSDAFMEYMMFLQN